MKRPLNVLYLIRTWALGGSHTIIRLLMKHLPPEEFNIITVPYDAPGTGNADFVRAAEREGLIVAPERIPWNTRGNWFSARRTIQELIRKYEIDLLHAHDTHSIVLVGVGRGAYPCAAVGSPYGWWEAPWHLQAKAYHWVEKNVALPNFERVYTVSENMKHKVMQGRTPEDRIRVIHTGIDLANIDAGGSRKDSRAALGIADGDFVAGTVSRLFKEKGHKHLLNAAAQLLPRHPQLRLLIVGTGDERVNLEAQAKDLGISERVTFTGFYIDIAGAFRAMDVFVQPSIDAEGFPTAVLEAQAAGLPVIASDIGGTKETMSVGVTGMLVPPGDEATLAAALEDLFVHPDNRNAMAAAARPWIESQFTMADMLRKMGETYHEAMEVYRQRKG